MDSKTLETGHEVMRENAHRVHCGDESVKCGPSQDVPEN